jgi:hypothetical protein
MNNTNATASAEPGLLWWKLTLDKSGAILSCEQVDQVEANGKLTCYVQATGKVDACARTKAWWEARKARKLAYKTQRRAALAAKGLCRCGRRPPKPGGKACQDCLTLGAAQLKRSRDRQKGLDVPLKAPRYATEAAAIEAYRNAERASKQKNAGPNKRAGLHCFLRGHIVLAQFDALGPEAFRAWLVQKIEDSKGTPQ